MSDFKTFSFRQALRATVVASVLGLGACGGGLFVSVGPDDDAPAVALTASNFSPRPGQTVRLAAAASDDYGVKSVALYRLEDDGRTTLLGNDDEAPYQFDTVVPLVDTGTQLRYFARAVDGAGHRSDSAPVVLIVR